MSRPKLLPCYIILQTTWQVLAKVVEMHNVKKFSKLVAKEFLSQTHLDFHPLQFIVELGRVQIFRVLGLIGLWISGSGM